MLQLAAAAASCMNMNHFKIKIVAFIVLVVCGIPPSNSLPQLTEGPASLSTLIGNEAQFHCIGISSAPLLIVVWMVDGMLATDSSITDRGIIPKDPTRSSDTIRGTLVVPATLVNNGTTVQCSVVSHGSGSSDLSSNATLTVLPGIGVFNVMFIPSEAVLWDPPATAGVFDGVSYIVIVMNNNTGQVIVNVTTNSTSYPLPPLENCQCYTVNVTAFSSEYQSVSFTEHRTKGQYYNLMSVSPPEVISYNTTHCAIISRVKIDLKSDFEVICPDQDLMLVTYPAVNSSKKTIHAIVNITQPDTMNYTIFVEKGCHCSFDTIIIVDDEEIEKRTMSFSSYNVQGCVMSTDNSSILVECTFAINSTAPGIVVIQDDQSQYTINKTLQRFGDKGSVNITDLPAGAYNGSVYDVIKDNKPAYEHPQLMHIIAPKLQTTSASSISTVVKTHTSAVVPSSSITPTMEPIMPTSSFSTVDIIIIIVALAAAIIVAIIVITAILLTLYKYYAIQKCCCHTVMQPANQQQNPVQLINRRIIQEANHGLEPPAAISDDMHST